VNGPRPVILLTGASGQVGWELRRTLAALGDVVAPSRAELDLARPDSLREVVRALAPALIVNPAAYTGVDAAEREPDLARAINAAAPGVLAEEAAHLGAPLVHFSTDYVFDGAKRTPYDEEDTPNPLSAYGESKLAGERLARERCTRAMVIRVAALFGIARSAGKGGTNFVETMLRAAAAGRPLRVVVDQTTGPSYTVHVARSVWRLVAGAPAGTYHVTAHGQTTWYDFAREIFRREGLTPALTGVSAAEFGAPAKRPAYSVLGHRALRALGHPEPPAWMDGLDAYLAERRALSATAPRDSGPRTSG
jgi:dTDP-4-dehydrorhamnose reductase